MNPVAWAKRLLHRKAHYKATFESADGKRVLSDLISYCGLYRSAFIPNDPNGRASAFAEGRRDAALYILRVLGMDEEKARALAQENSYDD